MTENPLITARQLLEEAAELARHSNSDATPWDARILLADSLGSRNPLAVDPAAEVAAETAERFREAWKSRVRGVPVQYILGEWDFYGRAFRVDSRALVPRPETETLVAVALEEAPAARRILDAGTGSGILAITLLVERPRARAVAVDASLDALALARENAVRHGVTERLRLVGSDWLSAIGDSRFDLAVSNPPYLAVSEAASLSRSVREHEPSIALFAGPEGVSSIRSLLDALPRLLAPGAAFLCEIGYGHGRSVEEEIRRRQAWSFERIVPDQAGVPRVAVARRRADGADASASGPDAVPDAPNASIR